MSFDLQSEMIKWDLGKSNSTVAGAASEIILSSAKFWLKGHFPTNQWLFYSHPEQSLIAVDLIYIVCVYGGGGAPSLSTTVHLPQ